jgi:hypothetical protein
MPVLFTPQLLQGRAYKITDSDAGGAARNAAGTVS